MPIVALHQSFRSSRPSAETFCLSRNVLDGEADLFMRARLRAYAEAANSNNVAIGACLLMPAEAA